MILSQKQNKLLNDIIAENIPKISVLGSTQSGKTFTICLGTIMYAKQLHQYDKTAHYNGAIISWSLKSLRGNIIEPLLSMYEAFGYVNGKDYTYKTDEYIEFLNIRYYLFPFNNKLSYNNIQGRPLIFIWVDESAKIYSNLNLQESFDNLPTRQLAYAGHPLFKNIHSYNVEGNERHPYKIKYVDEFDGVKYTFYPFDNPVIDNDYKVQEVLKTYPKGSALREQKIYNKWVVAEGRVFNTINKIDSLEDITIKEIGIGVDYGSTNPTTFVPIALAFDRKQSRWILIRLPVYYHDPSIEGDKPTTAYFVEQEKSFINYIASLYKVPITANVVDSEAEHFCNALYNANVTYTGAKKGAGSVDRLVQYLQSLIYKKVFYIYEGKSISEFDINGEPVFMNRDESLNEFESYQYDNIKSISTGQNCYKKEADHTVDACLTGDTIITTTDGEKRLDELVGNEGTLYSYNGKNFETDKYNNVRLTQKNVDIYELELENGYKIKGTYEHRILTTKGWKKLGELTKKDNIIIA